MLCLSLLPGEYLTIGEKVVLQYNQTTGERCKLILNAPREIPIVRGKVLEREGGERPDCVFDQPRQRRQGIPWNRSKAQALAAMRKLLSQMDGHDQNVQDLRRQLNHLFPPTRDADSQSPIRPSREARTAEI